METALAYARAVFDGLLVALLPSPERESHARKTGVNAPRFSFAVGLVQFLFGGWLFLWGGLMYIGAVSGDQLTILLENWWPGLSTTHLQGVGLINWFAWFFNPSSWPFAYLGVTGLLRMAVFGIGGEAMAEPVVWAGMRISQRVLGRRRAKAREQELGPVRPDRIVEREGGGVVVLTCREKDDWNEMTTIAIGERFFRLDRIEDWKTGEQVWIAYVLRPEDPSAVIRRLINYDPGSDPVTDSVTTPL